MNNYDILDNFLAADAKQIIKKRPFRYFLLGFVELNNLNSPIIYHDRHFSIFHDNIYHNTMLKTLGIIIFEIDVVSFFNICFLWHLLYN